MSSRNRSQPKTIGMKEPAMKTLLNTLFITSEDAYAALENENVKVLQGERTMAMIPLRSLSSILCFSYKGASPALMGKCSELGIGMSFFSPRGRFYCSVLGENNRNVLLRRAQFRDADNTDLALPFAKSFMIGKVFNAKWVLERTKRDHGLRVGVMRLVQQTEKLDHAIASIGECQDMDTLRGIEGNAAREYFYVFDDLILRNKEVFYFNERSRRPPLDALNALLSFVYAILTTDCTAALQGAGLDPYVGFMHVDRPGRPSLALDLIEEFRPVLADRFALTLINTGAINGSDFESRENGGVFLTERGRKKVLSNWQRHKSQELTHPYLREKITWGLVPHVQSLLLARSIRGDIDGYPPFLWK